MRNKVITLEKSEYSVVSETTHVGVISLIKPEYSAKTGESVVLGAVNDIEQDWLDWPPTDDETYLAMMAKLGGTDDTSGQ